MNEVNPRKFRALMWMLTPQSNGFDAPVSPWSLEKNRTFHCKCGKKKIFPEDSIVRKVVGKKKDGSDDEVVSLNMGSSMKCDACGNDNYELMSFAFRYGLIPDPPPVVRKKKKLEPMIDFQSVGYIRCGRQA